MVTEYKTSNAKPYTPSALAGYAADQYSIGLADAWDKAKNSMLPMLRKKNTENESATYHKDNQLYTIVINGQTGEISGKWPKSFGTFLKSAIDLFF